MGCFPCSLILKEKVYLVNLVRVYSVKGVHFGEILGLFSLFLWQCVSAEGWTKRLCQCAIGLCGWWSLSVGCSLSHFFLLVVGVMLSLVGFVST